MKLQIEVESEVLQLIANAVSLVAAQLNGDIKGTLLAYQHVEVQSSVPGVVTKLNDFMDRVSDELAKAGIKTVNEEEFFPERASRFN